MLEDIIDKASSDRKKESNDEKELPSSLPSSHAKYSKHRTTFGEVRVDIQSKSQQRQMIEALYKNYDPASEQNRTFDSRIWSLVDEDVSHENHDIDFYGLVNAHYRNISFQEKLSSSKQEDSCSKEEPSDNYIDQLAFPELTTKKTESKTTPLQKETIQELKNEEMGIVDEQYFGTLKQLEHQDQQIDKTMPIKQIKMPPAEELNYIDQLVFSTPTSAEKTITENQTPTPNVKAKQAKTSSPILELETNKAKESRPVDKSATVSSDNLLDINFKYRISDPVPKIKTKSEPKLNESPMDSYNPKLESMRSIKSKDYFDPPRQSSLDVQQNKDYESAKTAAEPAENIREQLTKKVNARDSLGYRTFDNLIPKWWTMTKAEIVDVLIKQICFMRRGPGVQMSIAYLIPQIIERLNKPEIKQLHLLHRLDKQSTGVLLMAYTTEAETRLRELMLEKKLIKQYITIVRGKPQPSEGEINIPIVERDVRGTYKMMLSPNYNELAKLVMPKGKREHIHGSAAITKYRVLDSNYGVSLVECQPVTGVKHQIRTHLAHALGTPILGDHKYSHYAKLAPQKLPFVTLKKLGVRQAKVRTIPLCLHSYSVAIPNFLHHQQNIFIRAHLSHHLRYFIQCLRLRMIK